MNNSLGWNLKFQYDLNTFVVLPIFVSHCSFLSSFFGNWWNTISKFAFLLLRKLILHLGWQQVDIIEVCQVKANYAKNSVGSIQFFKNFVRLVEHCATL